jgi:hypothetical protein
LGFASLYEAVAFGAALFAAMVLGILFSSEGKRSTPLGRWRAVEGLGMFFLVPSFYVAVLWVGANAVIMGDPLFFATSTYSNAGYTAITETGVARSVEGSLFGALAFSLKRAVPFLIPGASLLLVRALDGRFWRINTLSLVLLMLSVPFGLIVPLVYLGSSYGWLRFFIYPLLVAAGWGLYEVALSRRRRLATRLVLASWVVAAPAILWAMANPSMGQEENREVQGLIKGENAAQIGFDTTAKTMTLDAPVAQYVNSLPKDSQVVVDNLKGWTIAPQVSPQYLKNVLLLTPDLRFKGAVQDPRAYGISHFLVPNPATAPNDQLVSTYPDLWAGDEPGFELAKSFPDTPQEWRLYRIVSPGTGELERNEAWLNGQANDPSDEQVNKRTGSVAERDQVTAADSSSDQESPEANVTASTVTDTPRNVLATPSDTGAPEDPAYGGASSGCERTQTGCLTDLAAGIDPEIDYGGGEIDADGDGLGN